MTNPFIPGLTPATYEKLEALGYTDEEHLERLPVAGLLAAGVTWGQVHKIISWLVANGRRPIFRGPDPSWDDASWRGLLDTIVAKGIVTWQEVAVAVLGGAQSSSGRHEPRVQRQHQGAVSAPAGHAPCDRLVLRAGRQVCAVR